MSMPISEIITVDLTPGGIIPVCHASQFDNGRVIKVMLKNNGQIFTIRTGDSFVIDVRKPDGTVVTRSIVPHTDTPWIGSDYVYFTTTEQMVAVNGDDICELKLTDSDENEIGTANFILRVEQSPLDGGVQSASAIHDLETQVEDIVENNLEIGDLSDVQLQIHPGMNGEVLTWNESNHAWTNATPGSMSVAHLTDIGDVNGWASGYEPQTGSPLIYDASTDKWSAGAHIVPYFIDHLEDVFIYSGTLATGQALIYGGSEIGWTNRKPSLDMVDLNDVAYQGSGSVVRQYGQTLVWKSLGALGDAWTNDYLTFDSISDISIDQLGLADRSILSYDANSGKWVNRGRPDSTDLLYIELTGTLTAGSTSITLTDNSRRFQLSQQTLDFYTDIYGVNPTSVTVSDYDPSDPTTFSSVTLTFEAQSSDMNVKVRIS